MRRIVPFLLVIVLLAACVGTPISTATPTQDQAVAPAAGLS